MNLFTSDSENIPKGFTHAIYAADEWTLQNVLEHGDTSNCVFSTSNNISGSGWVMVGYANIYSELFSRELLTKNAVAGVDEQIKEVQANSHMVLQQLQDRKQKLLAINFHPTDKGDYE